MPKLGRTNLHNEKKSLYEGGAFLLSTPSQITETVVLPNGNEIIVHRGNPYAVSRIKDTSNPRLYSYETIQEGLDWLSVVGKADMSLNLIEDEYLSWGKENGKKVIRIFMKQILTASGQVCAYVGEKDHSLDTPIKAESEYPGFRFFRLAQCTDDLFDAYRNMYLAFEVTLSRKYSKKGREREWLQQAINKANSELGLSNLFDEIDDDEFTQYIMNKIYDDARLPLFHATYDRKYYEPQTLEKHRESISESLKILTKIVLEMFRAWHNAYPKKSSINTSALYEQIHSLFTDSKMIISDQVNDDPNESDLSHARFESGIESTNIKIKTDTSDIPFVEGKINTSDLEGLNKINQFDMVKDDSILSKHILESDLEISNLDLIELHVRFKVIDANQPKASFRA